MQTKEYHEIYIPATDKKVSVELWRENGKTIALRRALPEHMLQHPLGWAFSREVLQFFKERGVNEIVVRCGRQEWRCSFSLFLQKGVYIARGWGDQWALPLSYWRTTEANEEVKHEECEQLSLFA